MDDTVEIVEGMIASGRPHYLATANVDFTVQALEDEELRRILFDAHLVLCDGTPLLWVSRWLGQRLPERVAGSDLVPILIELAARKGHRIYFLGGRPDVTERAIANLRKQYPTLKIAGWESPAFAPLQEMDHEGIAERIRASKADLLFVSFGCPKQEKWIAMNYRAIGVPVSVGVGATIDFIAGEMLRAPVWMRKVGLEWLFRLLQEPRRLFQRYVKDFWVFGWGFLGQYRQLRPGRKVRPAAPVLPEYESKAAAHPARLSLPSRVDAAFIAESAPLWERFGSAGLTLLVDAALVEFVDSTGVGALIRLRKRLKEQEADLIIVGASPALMRGLELMKLATLFDMVPGWAEADERAAQLELERKAPVRVDREKAKPQLNWTGEVTAATVDEMWGRTAILLEAHSHKDEEMAIGLQDVRFVDSAGLGFMVRVRRMGRQYGMAVRFVNASDAVKRVVRTARMEEFLLGEAA